MGLSPARRREPLIFMLANRFQGTTGDHAPVSARLAELTAANSPLDVEATRALVALLDRIESSLATLAWADEARLAIDLHAMRARLRLPRMGSEPEETEQRFRAIDQRLRVLLATFAARSDERFATDRATIRAGGLRGAELIAWIAEYPPEQREMALEHLLDVTQASVGTVQAHPERIGYIPSGISPIVQIVRNVPIGPDDVFVDIGSGLGKVTLAVHLLSGARVRGIELELDWLRAAARSAASLTLDAVEHEFGDAREADFSGASVVFLYLPCTGASLATVMQRIESAARQRSLVVCSLGLDLGAYSWLQEREGSELWLSIYDSRIPGSVPRRGRAPEPLGAAAEAVATERSLHDVVAAHAH